MDDFQVDFISGNLANQTANGSSNGIAWSMSLTFIAQNASRTDDSFTGFSSPAFYDPSIPATDVIHVGADDFTLTFAEEIVSVLLYLQESSGSAELDFGITPVLVSGEVSFNGTPMAPTVNGGVVRLDGIGSTTLQHVSAVHDGLNLAFFVEAAVPEPRAGLLVSLVAGVAICDRRNRS